MKQKAIFFIFAVLLLAPVNACSRKDPAGTSKVDFEFIDNVWETLYRNYHDPAQLDYQKLANAALDKLSESLPRQDVIYVPNKINKRAFIYKRRQFFEEIKRAEKLAKGAVSEEHFFEFTVARAMLAAVGDSHTEFITPKIYKDGKKISDGDAIFAGIGAAIEKLEDEFFYLAEVYPDLAADKANLQKFDRILAVDGEKMTARHTVEELINKIRGPKGSVVKLEIERRGEKKVFQVERDDVVLPVMKSRILNHDERRLGYLRIYSFLPQFSRKDIDELIGVLEPAATDGVIIDLRGNSGGTIGVLTACLGSFFETGTPLFAIKSVRGQHVYHSEISVCTEKPITVLVNENSCSAAEVFPAVIQEKKRGTIIGKKTSGAVSVGSLFPLPHEAAMCVTIRQLITAGGKKLEGIGVTPDVEAAIAKEDVLNARDSQLEKAIEILLEKIESR